MPNSRPDSLVRKGSPGAALVVVHPDTFLLLVQASAERMPSEVAGVLAGAVQTLKQGRLRFAVRRIVPISLVPLGLGFSLDRTEWQNASAAVQSQGLSIIGWFYSDSGIGVFPPRLDVQDIQKEFAPGESLLLLANPFTGEGSFYLWQGERYTATGGFYEVVHKETTDSVIPWTGNISGGLEWLGALEPDSRFSSAHDQTTLSETEHSLRHIWREAAETGPDNSADASSVPHEPNYPTPQPEARTGGVPVSEVNRARGTNVPPARFPGGQHSEPDTARKPHADNTDRDIQWGAASSNDATRTAQAKQADDRTLSTQASNALSMLNDLPPVEILFLEPAPRKRSNSGKLAIAFLILWLLIGLGLCALILSRDSTILNKSGHEHSQTVGLAFRIPASGTDAVSDTSSIRVMDGNHTELLVPSGCRTAFAAFSAGACTCVSLPIDRGPGKALPGPQDYLRL